MSQRLRALGVAAPCLRVQLRERRHRSTEQHGTRSSSVTQDALPLLPAMRDARRMLPWRHFDVADESVQPLKGARRPHDRPISPIRRNSRRRRYSNFFVFRHFYRAFFGSRNHEGFRVTFLVISEFKMRKFPGKKSEKRKYWNDVVFWNYDK